MNRMLIPISACSRRNEIEDLRLDGDIERGRRLVGDEQTWVARQGEGDHRPLPHAARHLVRVVVEPPFCGRDLDQFEHPAGALAGFRRERLMQTDHLDDLIPNREERVEARHRLLEDHGDLPTPDLPHRLPAECGQIEDRSVHGAVEDTPPDDAAGRREEAHDRQARHRLARPGFADDGDRLAAVHAEADAVDGLCDAIAELEVSPEFLDVEDNLAARMRHRPEIQPQ